MVPGFITSKLTFAKIVRWYEARNSELTLIERLTGFSSGSMPNKMDYAVISTRLSTLSAGIIDIRRYLRLLQDYNAFLSGEVERYHRVIANVPPSSPGPPTASGGLEEIGEALEILQLHVKVWASKTGTLGERQSNQMSALNNIIMREDVKMNLEIAESSRTFAIESKRDSSSMMTLAVVTMAFLPGTFVASFFAMPMFDWQLPAGKNVQSGCF